MEWVSLLSQQRLRRPEVGAQDGRNSYQQDLDRIVFSGAFRRLANKTQVHPLSPNDNVHTRLTHSIEVASVGRSLVAKTGNVIARRLKDPAITSDDFGYVVQAACLAHDIGNPPFGHSGEDAIRAWFKRAERDTLSEVGLAGAQRDDFVCFEGNAQGFRILTQLENNKYNGGLQLTYAVLGTFSKYTRSSVVPRDESHPEGKKVGFFDAERAYFAEVAEATGLIRRQSGQNYWCRHPLAFLVEAADDICYAIIDIEDGYSLGYLSFAEARDTLWPMAKDVVKLAPDLDETETIAKLRAVGIGRLVNEVSKAFVDNEQAILSGDFGHDLIGLTEFKGHIEHAKKFAMEKIYWSDRKTKLEIAGAQVIEGLLDMFVEVVTGLQRVDFDVTKLRGRPQSMARLMGRSLGNAKDSYTALLCVTDFVSGMTDRYAVEIYRTLKGITTNV